MAPPPAPPMPMRWVTHGQPLHRSLAAQAGLDAVATRWALFLDDDDELLAGHLDKLIVALESSSAAVLAHTGVDLVGSGSHEGRQGTFDEPFEPWELLLGNRMPIHAALFDAALAQSSGLRFDAALDVYEDWDFWLQLRQLGEFVHVPGVSARYRLGDDSSDAHRVNFGDEPYWRVWAKWWPRAPRAWWTKALHSGASASATTREYQAVRHELMAKLDALHAQWLQARGEVWQLQQQALATLAEISRLKQLAAERETLRAQTEQQLIASTAELGPTQALLATAQIELKATHGELDATASALATRSAELASSEALLSAARIELQRGAERIHALLTTSSWRLTQPLRQLISLWRATRLRFAQIRRSSRWRRFASSPGAAKSYEDWIRTAEIADVARRKIELSALPPMTISVLLPVFEPDLVLLDEAIESVRAQSHPHWELCIADDASTKVAVAEHLRQWAAREPRIKWVLRPQNGHISACTNSALALATGDWIALLDQDDVLAPNALAEVVDAIAQFPDAGIVYSDEDKLDAAARRFEPYFKPAFNIELMRGQNLISHFGAYRRSLVAEVGGLRAGFEGSQDYDLALRCIERLRPAQVIHVPRVLYHWRVSAGSTAGSGDNKPYAVHAGLRALSEHLARCEAGAQAELMPGFSYFRVRYPLPRVLPWVDLVAISNSNHPETEAWWKLLLEGTNYPALRRSTPTLVTDGTDAASAPLVAFIRVGLLPITPEWLAELVSHLMRPGNDFVGARIDARDSRLAEGALIGSNRTAWASSPSARGGYFGRAVLAQAVSATSEACVIVRRELLSNCDPGAMNQHRSLATMALARAFGERRRGVWTPFARLLADTRYALKLAVVNSEALDSDPAASPHRDEHNAQLLSRSESARAMQGW